MRPGVSAAAGQPQLGRVCGTHGAAACGVGSSWKDPEAWSPASALQPHWAPPSYKASSHCVVFRMLYPQPKVLTPSCLVQEERCPCPDPVAAPVIWKGSPDTDILNEQFRPQNATIRLMVFAIKKTSVHTGEPL
ncbi:histo-blood group ABO system transferase [Enhydra lutris kenyoni]|uniref:Histo-blood group ABO system transferase n=1 Tax=Enhydra lutris kenyoni TaxID=391180 RepID=A0A2Y9J848_ENHLU|nr:histo-blood group ABO system transferase [Enhydra lutris kenyoni]